MLINTLCSLKAIDCNNAKFTEATENLLNQRKNVQFNQKNHNDFKIHLLVAAYFLQFISRNSFDFIVLLYSLPNFFDMILFYPSFIFYFILKGARLSLHRNQNHSTYLLYQNIKALLAIVENSIVPEAIKGANFTNMCSTAMFSTAMCSTAMCTSFNPACFTN